MGVKEIPAEGEPFDPNLHQAIQQVEPQEGVESNTVVQEVQKGYMLGEKILRHSMVIVSK
jgi:molecular chaperone GrpE